jgi:hypothetical protein
MVLRELERLGRLSSQGLCRVIILFVLALLADGCSRGYVLRHETLGSEPGHAMPKVKPDYAKPVHRRYIPIPGDRWEWVYSGTVTTLLDDLAKPVSGRMVDYVTQGLDKDQIVINRDDELHADPSGQGMESRVNHSSITLRWDRSSDTYTPILKISGEGSKRTRRKIASGNWAPGVLVSGKHELKETYENGDVESTVEEIGTESQLQTDAGLFYVLHQSRRIESPGDVEKDIEGQYCPSIDALVTYSLNTASEKVKLSLKYRLVATNVDPGARHSTPTP